MNPRRVRIFLAEKGIEMTTIDIDMDKNEHKTPEFLAINPMGTLPVLELDDGSHLSESIAICRYFEALHPEPPMFGTTDLERAQVEMWNRRMELQIMQPASQMFRHTHPFWEGRHEQFADYGESCRADLSAKMDWLNGELESREFIAGNAYTVADITAQCALLLAKNCKLRINENQTHLQRWYDAVTSRPTARA
jgi:glutathione S-transferase